MIARLEMTPLKNHTAKQVPHTHARTHARTHSCTHARTHSEGINKQQQNHRFGQQHRPLYFTDQI